MQKQEEATEFRFDNLVGDIGQGPRGFAIVKDWIEDEQQLRWSTSNLGDLLSGDTVIVVRRRKRLAIIKTTEPDYKDQPVRKRLTLTQVRQGLEVPPRSQEEFKTRGPKKKANYQDLDAKAKERKAAKTKRSKRKK